MSHTIGFLQLDIVAIGASVYCSHVSVVGSLFGFRAAVVLYHAARVSLTAGLDSADFLSAG